MRSKKWIVNPIIGNAMKLTFNKQIWNATKNNQIFRIGRRLYEPIFRKFGLTIYQRRKSQVEIFMRQQAWKSDVIYAKP